MRWERPVEQEVPGSKPGRHPTKSPERQQKRPPMQGAVFVALVMGTHWNADRARVVRRAPRISADIALEPGMLLVT